MAFQRVGAGMVLLACGCFDPTALDGVDEAGDTTAAGSATDGAEDGATAPGSGEDAPTGDEAPSDDDASNDGDAPTDDAPADDDDGSSGHPDSSDDVAETITRGDGDTTSGDSTTTEPTPTCPDGVIGDDEECDDDNDVSGDGCTACSIDANHVCAGQPSECGALCDPLLQDCAGGCYSFGDVFACDDPGDADQGEACDSANDCTPGLACIVAFGLDGCTGEACCTTFCDLSGPSCPGALVCGQLAGLGPGYDDVGACGSP